MGQKWPNSIRVVLVKWLLPKTDRFVADPGFVLGAQHEAISIFCRANVVVDIYPKAGSQAMFASVQTPASRTIKLPL